MINIYHIKLLYYPKWTTISIVMTTAVLLLCYYGGCLTINKEYFALAVGALIYFYYFYSTALGVLRISYEDSRRGGENCVGVEREETTWLILPQLMMWLLKLERKMWHGVSYGERAEKKIFKQQQLTDRMGITNPWYGGGKKSKCSPLILECAMLSHRVLLLVSVYQEKRVMQRESLLGRYSTKEERIAILSKLTSPDHHLPRSTWFHFYSYAFFFNNQTNAGACRVKERSSDGVRWIHMRIKNTRQSTYS